MKSVTPLKKYASYVVLFSGLTLIYGQAAAVEQGKIAEIKCASEGVALAEAWLQVSLEVKTKFAEKHLKNQFGQSVPISYVDEVAQTYKKACTQP